MKESASVKAEKLLVRMQSLPLVPPTYERLASWAKRISSLTTDLSVSVEALTAEVADLHNVLRDKEAQLAEVAARQGSSGALGYVAARRWS